VPNKTSSRKLGLQPVGRVSHGLTPLFFFFRRPTPCRLVAPDIFRYAKWTCLRHRDLASRHCPVGSPPSHRYPFFPALLIPFKHKLRRGLASGVFETEPRPAKAPLQESSKNSQVLPFPYCINTPTPQQPTPPPPTKNHPPPQTQHKKAPVDEFSLGPLLPIPELHLVPRYQPRSLMRGSLRLQKTW